MGREEELSRTQTSEEHITVDELDEETQRTLEVSDKIEESLTGINERPVSSGTVRGLDEQDGTVLVSIETPENEISLDFDLEEEKTALSTFLDDAGASVTDAAAAIGASVPVVYLDGEWQYHWPKRRRSFMRKLHELGIITVDRDSQNPTWTITRRGNAVVWLPAALLFATFLINLLPAMAMGILFFWVFGSLAVADFLEKTLVSSRESRR